MELWKQLSVLVAEVSNQLDKKLARLAGIGLSEFLALNTLASGDPAGMRMQLLADALGLNQSSVSRLVTRLEERGLARRSTPQGDRRGVLAAITEQGREVNREANAMFGKEIALALDLASIDGRTATVVARLRYSPPDSPKAD
ncbi:MarR family winged helix-turn-helix transcriptional regulator [Micromonospora carbonacea]|uniref:MarR family winged helix-turn-helix transcriptional regulator n=1 Tax=Micromonospora carbonacea TaxID=47853 RepID=UPI003D95B176